MGFRDMVLLVVSNTDKLLVIMDNLCLCGLWMLHVSFVSVTRIMPDRFICHVYVKISNLEMFGLSDWRDLSQLCYPRIVIGSM